MVILTRGMHSTHTIVYHHLIVRQSYRNVFLPKRPLFIPSAREWGRIAKHNDVGNAEHNSPHMQCILACPCLCQQAIERESRERKPDIHVWGNNVRMRSCMRETSGEIPALTFTSVFTFTTWLLKVTLLPGVVQEQTVRMHANLSIVKQCEHGWQPGRT